LIVSLIQTIKREIASRAVSDAKSRADVGISSTLHGGSFCPDAFDPGLSHMIDRHLVVRLEGVVFQVVLGLGDNPPQQKRL
jgi:hypothetical protein